MAIALFPNVISNRRKRMGTYLNTCDWVCLFIFSQSDQKVFFVSYLNGGKEMPWAHPCESLIGIMLRSFLHYAWLVNCLSF